jgi:hypothetical protein
MALSKPLIGHRLRAALEIKKLCVQKFLASKATHCARKFGDAIGCVRCSEQSATAVRCR